MRDDGDCQPATRPERLALDETAGLAAGSAPIACSYVPKRGGKTQTAVTSDDAVRGIMHERAEGKRRRQI